MRSIRQIWCRSKEFYSVDGTEIIGVKTDNEEIDGISINRVHVLSSIGGEARQACWKLDYIRVYV